MKPEERRNPAKVSNHFTISQFSSHTRFNWLQNIINPILHQLRASYKLDESDRVVVTDPDFFVHLVEVLNKTNARNFHNYLGWKIAAKYGHLATEQLRVSQFEFLKVKTGVQSIPDRWRTCYSMLDAYLPFALSQLFVQHYFSEQEQLAVGLDRAQEIQLIRSFPCG